MIGCAVILQGSNPLALTSPRDNIRSLEFLSTDVRLHPCSNWCACIFSVKKTINPRFINVDETFGRNVFHRFNKGLPNIFIPLPKNGGFFYD